MTNDELFERARRVIPGGVNSPVRAFRAVGGTPRFIVRGDGAFIVKAGSGLATFGHPTSAGVPEAVVQHTLVLEYNNVAALDQAFAQHGKAIACAMIEPIAGNMNFVRASVPFMRRLRELCSAH